MALGLAIGIVGTLLSARSSRKASKQQQKANKARADIQRIKNKQAKRNFLKSFRLQQASAVVGGVAAGVDVESSRVQAQLASGQTQRRIGLQEFEQQEKLATTANIAEEASASRIRQAGVFGAVASFAQSSGGGDLLDKLF